MLLNRLASPVVFKHRCISTASNPFPFPATPRPSPHQIFHLQPGASQQDIKARYYDLVRVHHPDAPACRELSNADRTARFQAIMAAYDHLRGRSPHSPSASRHEWHDYAQEVARRRRAYERQRMYRSEQYANPPRYEWESNADDRWKDNMMIAFGILALIVGIAPGIFIHPYRMHQHNRSAVNNYSEARKDAHNDGDMRRKGVRSRAEQLRAERDSQ